MILHLTLFRKYFDLINAGLKKEEYRNNTPFWQKRLSKQYDTIIFRNGYSKKSPMLKVECKGIEFNQEKNLFIIKLGEIIERSEKVEAIQESLTGTTLIMK